LFNGMGSRCTDHCESGQTWQVEEAWHGLAWHGGGAQIGQERSPTRRAKPRENGIGNRFGSDATYWALNGGPVRDVLLCVIEV
jgi:hypothetical protein